jgi:hypothetical protein
MTACPQIYQEQGSAPGVQVNALTLPGKCAPLAKHKRTDMVPPVFLFL